MRFSKFLILLFVCVGAFRTHATLTSISVSTLQAQNGRLIDARDSASFNGWKTIDGGPGGHEPSSIHLAANWLTQINEPWLKRFLESTKLNAYDKIGIYGTSNEVDQIAALLRKSGFIKLFRISDALKTPASRVSLPHFEKLVPARWLSDLIAGKSVEAPPNSRWKLFEVAWGPPGKYLLEHIPQAGYVDTDSIEEGPLWNKRDDVSIKATLLKQGITAHTSVILYSRDTIGAARVAHILMYAGVQDVRLLDGGWEAWQASSHSSAAGPPAKSIAEKDFGGPFPANPELMLTLEQTRKLLADKKQNAVVSVRAWKEFIGERSGYSDIKPTGDIAGAVWGHAGSDAGHMEDYRNPDNTMRSAEDINAFWREWGIVPEKNVTFYCGTGWRASEAFFYAYVMGWPNIHVFDGGWKEWSLDPKNPVARGVRHVSPDVKAHL